METIVIGITAFLGLYMAWNIGANDVANSMADAVGSRALSVRNAVILAGICEFAGAVLVGAPVTDTVRKGIVSPDSFLTLPDITPEQAAALFVIGMTSALLSAAIWLNVSSFMGLPVSTTHSIVGSVAGFGIAAAGWSSVQWGKMTQIVLSWFISPIAGGIMAFVVFKFISRSILGQDRPARAAIKFAPFLVSAVTATVVLATIYKGLKHVIGNISWLTPQVSIYITVALSVISWFVSRWWLGRQLSGKDELSVDEQLDLVERVFVPLVIITSCSVAFAHGANDVANSVGPLAAVVRVLETGEVAQKVGVPFWVLVLGGSGIVLGLATFGYRVMYTVGMKITEITPSRGVAADLSATATVLLCTRLKLPISTTHTLVGAILGIGLARGLAGINRDVTKRIFGAWLITVPAAALLCVFLFLLGKMYFLETITRICTK